MQDLRIVLVIIGALAIAALIIHGLWTNRKQQRAPIKERPLGKVEHEPKRANRELSDDGFDADGIGQVRVVSPRVEPVAASKEIDEPAVKMPRIQAVPEPDDEMEALGPHEPQAAASTPRVRPVIKSWQDVYVINVVARQGRVIEGDDLSRGLRLLGFRFGDMGIYHRHLEMDGQGEVLFSLANMVKPGTFNPEVMHRFETPGVSLFMQLPPEGRGLAHFDLMLKAADKLAGEVNGILLDQRREPLTEQCVAQFRDELRAYDLH